MPCRDATAPFPGTFSSLDPGVGQRARQHQPSTRGNDAAPP